MPLVLPALTGLSIIGLMTALLLYAMLKAHPEWLRPIVTALTRPRRGLLDTILTAPARLIVRLVGGAVRRVEEFFIAYVGRFVWSKLRPVGAAFASLAVLGQELGFALAEFAQETYSALNYLTHVTVPKLINTAVKPVRALATRAWNLARAVDTAIDGAAERVRDVLDSLPWRITGGFVAVLGGFAAAFRNLWRYVYGRLTQRVDYIFDTALPRVQREITKLDDYVRDVLAKAVARMTVAVDRLENYVWGDVKPFLDQLMRGVIPAALLAAIVAALSAVWSGLFCRNTNEVGKRLCGLNSSGLDDFLAVMFTGVAIANLETLVRLAQAVADETFDGIQDLLEV